MQNNIISSHTLVFTLNGNNLLENITITDEVNNFIADFSTVDIDSLKSIKNNLTKFGVSVSKNKGTFVVVSNFSFDENLNIVPTLQEAQDFIEMEEIERQLNY
jgi:hypothetical protein